MITLFAALQFKLDEASLTLDQFKEIVIRLYSAGVILRAEGGSEARLYDEARRIEPLLNEYFSLAGFRLIHNSEFSYFRLFAPGTLIPGVADDAAEPVAALRAKLSRDFVAAALALRYLYQQALAEGSGSLTDDGELMIRFDELTITLVTQIKRALPESAFDREKLLRDLKRHRIIHFESNFSMTDESSLMLIRPTILTLISDDTLQAVLDRDLVSEGAAETPEAPMTGAALDEAVQVNSQDAESSIESEVEQEPEQ